MDINSNNYYLLYLIPPFSHDYSVIRLVSKIIFPSIHAGLSLI